MTQEALFQDLKVFIEKTFDEKFDQKFDQKFEQKFEEKFIDIRYQMADMQTSIKQLDIKIDTVAKSLRDDIAKLSKRTDEDYKALAKDTASLKTGKKSKEHCY